MRNLKRALSLALASVMVMGLMVVGTGASYADVSSEQNQEAIEVLQAVGVMTGDENGNFNPDANVTRNEMAVVMSNLLDYTVSSYKGTAPFSDVPSWAEPYVAACYTNGIIAGYDAKTFGGNDSVTTGQAALMLLKALGYFQYQSDFGDDWLVETTKQGSLAGLFDDVDTGATQALTRNDVAQMVLNALEATMVQYSGNGGTTIKGDGYEITTGKATYDDRTSTDKKYGKINDESANNNGKYIVQLGEDLYDGDLTKRPGSDDFGRPANSWKYQSTEVGTYSEAPDYTYVGKVTKGTLYSDVGKTVVNNINSTIGTADVNNQKYGVTVSVDGTPVTVSKGDLFDSNSSAHIQGDGKNLTGNGVQTEVYVDNSAYTIEICVINTYVMQATGDYNESKETLNVDVLSGPAKENSLDLEDFDTLAAYGEDDYILYTYANNEVQTIAKATLVQGEVESSTKNSVTIDGTSYSYAKVRSDDTAAGGEDGLTAFTAGENASIVLDAYGKLIWVDDASLSVGNYIYVDAADTTMLGKNAVAGAYTADGTYDEITVKKIKGDNVGGSGVDEITDATEIYEYLTGKGASAPFNTAHKNWYSYTVDSSDRYTLTVTSTGKTVKSDVVGESVRFLTADTSIRGNSDTVFIVDDGSDITVYTGVNSAPTVTAKSGKDVIVSYLKVDDKASKSYASLVFVDASDATIDDSTASSDLMFVLKLNKTYNDANDTVNVYDVVLNGEKTTVESTDTLAVGEMYYKIKTDSDERVTDDSKVFTTAAGGEYRKVALVNATVEYSSGALRVGTTDFTVAEDAQINLVLMKGAGDVMNDSAADFEVYSVSARGLESSLKGYAVSGTFYAVTTEDDNDELGTLYVVVKGSSDGITGSTLTPDDIDNMNEMEAGDVLVGDKDDIDGITGAPSDMAEGGHVFLAFEASKGDEITLTITDSDGDVVYKEETGEMSKGGTFHFYVSLTGHNAAADGKSGTWVSEDAGNANPGEEAAKGTYAFSIIGGTDNVYGAFTVE